jgi:hypothetical protein
MRSSGQVSGVGYWVKGLRCLLVMQNFSFWQGIYFRTRWAVGRKQKLEGGGSGDRGTSRLDCLSSDNDRLTHWAGSKLLGQQLHDDSMLGLHSFHVWEAPSSEEAPEALGRARAMSLPWHGLVAGCPK